MDNNILCTLCTDKTKLPVHKRIHYVTYISSWVKSEAFPGLSYQSSHMSIRQSESEYRIIREMIINIAPEYNISHVPQLLRNVNLRGLEEKVCERRGLSFPLSDAYILFCP